tara:strand:+ start:472 stop:2331 length:1860 start_codon:yes stop_codon:yes gene_type:complete
MAKVIKDLIIDLGSIAYAGEQRSFSVTGDDGAIFSLEVKNEDGYYYNFDTQLFASTPKKLKNKKITGGIFESSIKFPTVTDDDQYDIYLHAESIHDTTHVDYSEVRFGDGSIDINSSKGSNSNLLQKVLYQYADTVVTLSATAPAVLRGTTDFTGTTVTTDTITVGRGKSIGKTAFSVSVLAATTKAFQINRQPVEDDLVAFTTAVFGDPVQIYRENIWAGTARNTDTVDGDFSGGTTKIVMDSNVATKMKVGDRVTGTGISSSAVVTVLALNPDGDNVKEFSVSEAVEINDGVTLTFTAPHYYRWNVAAASSLHKLAEGMIYVDSDWPDVDRISISSYEDKTTYTTETHNEDGTITEVENETVHVSLPGIDPLGYKPTITNGVVTKQLGNITFSDQVINDVDDTNNKYFYGYGPSMIKVINNCTVKLSDLKVTLTKPITYTTSTVSDSTTIAVADREGTIANVSTVSGIGIGISHTDTVDGNFAIATKIVMDNNVAGHMRVGDIVTGLGIPKSSTVTVVALNPDGDNVKEFSVSESVTIATGTTLTFKPQSSPVVTSSTADGAGNWTVDVAQTLESGAVLTVDNTSRIATITGNIELINVEDASFALYFDIEKFLTAS